MAGEIVDAAWLIKQFEKFGSKMESELKEVRHELMQTRHTHRATIDTVAMQVGQLVVQMNTLAREVQEIQVYRLEGGPLDARFNRHDERIRLADAWRNRMIGGMVLLTVLFPMCISALALILKPR